MGYYRVLCVQSPDIASATILLPSAVFVKHGRQTNRKKNDKNERMPLGAASI